MRRWSSFSRQVEGNLDPVQRVIPLTRDTDLTRVAGSVLPKEGKLLLSERISDLQASGSSPMFILGEPHYKHWKRHLFNDIHEPIVNVIKG